MRQNLNSDNSVGSNTTLMTHLYDKRFNKDSKIQEGKIQTVSNSKNKKQKKIGMKIDINEFDLEELKLENHLISLSNNIQSQSKHKNSKENSDIKIHKSKAEYSKPFKNQHKDGVIYQIDNVAQEEFIDDGYQIVGVHSEGNFQETSRHWIGTQSLTGTNELNQLNNQNNSSIDYINHKLQDKNCRKESNKTCQKCNKSIHVCTKNENFHQINEESIDSIDNSDDHEISSEQTEITNELESETDSIIEDTDLHEIKDKTNSDWVEIDSEQSSETDDDYSVKSEDEVESHNVQTKNQSNMNNPEDQKIENIHNLNVQYIDSSFDSSQSSDDNSQQ